MASLAYLSSIFNSLIISLNNVIMLLNSRKKTLNLSSKIVQYYRFINNEETSFELEEDNCPFLYYRIEAKEKYEYYLSKVEEAKQIVKMFQVNEAKE